MAPKRNLRSLKAFAEQPGAPASMPPTPRKLRQLPGRLAISAICACVAAFSLPQSSRADDGWSFKVTPYVWMAGLDGKTSTLAGTPTADIDLSFKDILENLDFAGFLSAEARHGDFFFVGDLAYASVSDSAKISSLLVSKVKVQSKTFTGTLAAGYTLFRNENFQAGAFGGARIWSIDNTIKLNGGLLDGVKRSHTETFVDPIVGAAIEYDFSPRWSVRGSGSIGGFGAASDFEWGFTTTVSYQAGKNWGVVAGYRYLSVDYDRHGFVYDADQHGPLLGVYFTF